MRRMFAALGVAALLVIAGAVPATAAEPVTPVTPIPELPSNTLRMTPTASGSWTASDWWKYVFWKSAQPGTEVATVANGAKVPVVAKPITPPATFARGAAGGPLVGSFMGGFALGTGGLVLYGALTGDDPFDNLCGTGFEGFGHVMYMGFMPECKAPVIDPNIDALAGTTYDFGAAGSFVFKTSTQTGTGAWPYWWCGPSTRLPTGQSFVGTLVNGATTGAFAYAIPGAKSECSRSATIYYNNGSMLLSKIELRSGTTVLQSRSGVTTSGDPDRRPSCTIQWSDGSSTNATGTIYKDSLGVPMSVGGLGCKNAWDAKPGAGTSVMPDSIGVDSTDTETGSKTQIATTDVPDFDATQKKALDPKQGNGRGLVLEKVVNADTLSCMTWEADCAGWWDATDEGTMTPTPYKCTFAGNPVPLPECGPYRHTFDTKTATPTITDPTTGQPVPWSGPGVTPGTINGAVTGGGACGAAWSWNPVDWVVNPLKCAFIPAEAKPAQATAAMQASLAPTMLGKLPPLVVTAFSPPEGMSGCQGPHIFMPFSNFGHGWQDISWYPLNACTAPMSDVAAMARLIGSGVLIYLTALGIVRRISAVINAPGIGTEAAA